MTRVSKVIPIRIVLVLLCLSSAGISVAQESDEISGVEGAVEVEVQTDAEASQLEAESEDNTRPPRIVEALRRYAIATERANNSDCGAAIAEFEAVHEILEIEDERYSVLFNMAVCYEELLRFDEAISAYRRFLEEAPSDGEDPLRAQRSIRRIEAMLATVVIFSNVPAAVWIDAQVVGQVEGEGRFRVTAGRHTIELRAAGFEQAQQEVSLASGITEELRFALAELNDFEGISTGWVWAAGSLAVAAAIAGGISGGIALGRSDVSDRPIHAGDVANVQTPALVADVLFGVAGALAITTIVLAATADWDGDSDEDADAMTVSVGLGTVSVQGTF